MSETTLSELPDLWPIEVTAPDILTPLMILRHQAGLLRQRTKNLLEAEVRSIGSLTKHAKYDFVIIAPSLDRASVSLFTVEHEKDMVYPAWVSSARVFGIDENGEALNRFAPTQGRFLAILREVFASPDTASIIQSMIARINEARSPASTNATG
ncbi:MAG: hypothetical protein L0211_23555 [Planctomycetaceae bacterium]|nr:hypothetical protein [Planctomycetaceae bacterium]